MVLKYNSYLFCGVGGSGMSALAKIVLSKGAIVFGSDRNYDAGRFPALYQTLTDAGVQLVPQDGTGIRDGAECLVISSAVEPSIPDVKRALDNSIPIMKRAELLAGICNQSQSICVGGTNGKSTVTGMIGWMLNQCGAGPTIINGGGMLNFGRENAVIGKGDKVVVETDESDGTITNFNAHIAVLTNIAEDHKDMAELLSIFDQYLSQSTHQVLNIDCPSVARLAEKYPDAMTYSLSDYPDDLGLIVPGMHNKSNAMAALGVAKILGLDDVQAKNALSTFKGITSRLEVIGQANGITVIDDFGHNPDKIAAGLKTLKEGKGRLVLMYQPHGFKPTRQHKNELIDIFAAYLVADDLFYMPEIVYFGGTVDRDISSQDIVKPLRDKGVNAHFFETKQEIENDIVKQAQSGDTICIMGARDDSLREMAQSIFQKIS